MKTKRTRIAVILMSIALLCSTTAFSFASAGEDLFLEELLEDELLSDDTVIEGQAGDMLVPFSTTEFTIKAGFKKDSGKGVATVSAIKIKSEKLTSTIKLQVYSESQKKYVNSSASAATKSKNGQSIVHKATFSISSSKKYRVKITITSKEGSATYSKTVYRTLS